MQRASHTRKNFLTLSPYTHLQLHSSHQKFSVAKVTCKPHQEHSLNMLLIKVGTPPHHSYISHHHDDDELSPPGRLQSESLIGFPKHWLMPYTRSWQEQFLTIKRDWNATFFQLLLFLSRWPSFSCHETLLDLFIKLIYCLESSNADSWVLFR